MKLSRIIIIFIVVVIAGGIGLWYQNYQKSQSQTEATSSGPLRSGMKFPNITISHLNGERFEILGPATQGRIVVVNFWASWCGPCVEEFPSLIRFAKENGKDVVVLAISMDSNKEDVERFLKAYPETKDTPNFKILWEKGFRAPDSLELDRLPETYILNQKGIYIKQVSGSVDWQSNEVKNWLSSVLQR